jgi:hypothetical protein
MVGVSWISQSIDAAWPGIDRRGRAGVGIGGMNPTKRRERIAAPGLVHSW